MNGVSGLRFLVGIALAAMIVAPAGAAEIQGAAQLGPVATLAKPADGFVGRLALEPHQGPIGTPVTVSGRACQPTRSSIWSGGQSKEAGRSPMRNITDANTRPWVMSLPK